MGNDMPRDARRFTTLHLGSFLLKYCFQSPGKTFEAQVFLLSSQEVMEEKTGLKERFKAKSDILVSIMNAGKS